MSLVSFTEAAGVPIHYAREPVAPYGTRGKGPRTVRATFAFKALLDAWMTDLIERCPWGKPELLVSAGFQVPKGSAHNAHRRGLAFDLDSLWWPGGRQLVCRVAAATQPELYLAVEASLRRHFGVVLGANYNRAHADHFHVDASRPAGWNEQSHQRVLFVQVACNLLYDAKLKEDGQWGPKTALAAADAAWNLGLDAPLSVKTWGAFLDRIEAFAWTHPATHLSF